MITNLGRALSFFATQRVGMRKVKLEKSDGITEDEGMKVSARVAKNRVAKGNPYKATKYTALYGSGIDRVRGVAEMAIDEEIVQGGSWIYYPNKDNVATLADGQLAKWNGKGKFIDYLRDNEEFFEQLRAEIEDKAKQGTSLTITNLSDEEIAEIEAEEAAAEEVFGEDEE